MQSSNIQEILDESPYNDNYGVCRIQLALFQRGVKAGIRHINRIMYENSRKGSPLAA